MQFVHATFAYVYLYKAYQPVFQGKLLKTLYEREFKYKYLHMPFITYDNQSSNTFKVNT